MSAQHVPALDVHFIMGVASCLRWEPWVRMSNVTSTHRHDYRWPSKSCLVPKAEAPNGHCTVRPGASGDQSSLPWCGRDQPSLTQDLTLGIQGIRECKDLMPNVEDRPWCQRGLLVDKISPKPNITPTLHCLDKPSAPTNTWCDGDEMVIAARVGAAPEQAISRYDQPNQYLQKFCDKFPEPFAVVSATPRDELVRRIYADRYRTTYQNDFCTNSSDTIRKITDCDVPNLSKPQVVSEVTNGTLQCQTSSPQLRPPACRPTAISQHVHFSCCTPKKVIGSQGEEVGPPEKIPPWASEYTDGIGHTAQLIMKQRLLCPSKKRKA